MKKTLSIILSMILMTAALGAAAEGAPDSTTAPAAIQAFVALTGVEIDPAAAAKSDEYLDKVMNGEYTPAPADMETAKKMAPELPGLSSVTTKDIAVYSVDKQIAPAYVRNAYFRSLANVLRAEIMVNPASEETYKNIEVILSLFLSEDDSAINETSRDAIRETITRDHTRQIASGYKLPQDFVEFLIMDDKWDDDDWTNDNDWKDGTDLPNWNTDDLYDDSLEDYVDTDGIDDNSIDLDSQDADSVDLNSLDSADSVDYNSVDTNSPDYNSADSVDYNSADTNSPDYNSPDTPDYNSPATPDYNSPATPDYNSPDTPDYNSPATPDSPDSPDYEDS